MYSVQQLSDSIGLPVSGLKLVLSVYVGYILSALHRRIFYKQPSAYQHFYFTLSGALLMYWNYGAGIWHSVFCITLQWLIFNIIGTSKLCIAVSFPFQLVYLVAGYVYTATEGYDITWTMAHCILTLRLIGLSFDVYDGHRDKDKVTAEQKTLLISDVPTLLEIFGFCYFFGGFNIGPQFPLRRYRQMVHRELTETPGELPNSVYPGLRRGLSGTILLAVQSALEAQLPESTMLEPEFLKSSVWWIILVVCLRGHLLLYKYVAIWMINEGACILSGLGYYKEGDKVKWDAVRNVRLGKFTFSRSFQELIQAFNINTNQWVARYVYKRLRFLGNRNISHICTLMFLAIWHGYHEGYFTCFLYEFLVITVEKPVQAALVQLPIVKSLQSSKTTSLIPNIICWLYVRLIFGYCLLDFSLRKWKLYAPIYMSMFYYGHLFYIVLWIILQIYLSMKTKPDVKKE